MSQERSLEALHQFVDPSLLEEALTHPSLANETGAPHYERLEFLGDAVLDLVVGEHLYRSLPQACEGDLSRLRAERVNGKRLAALAREWGLTKRLRLGQGATNEFIASGHSDRIAASVVESVLGAIYLDGGLEPAREAVRRLLGIHWDEIPLPGRDPTSQLVQEVQRAFGFPPEFEDEEIGSPQEPRFRVVVRVGQNELGAAEGKSKAEARRKASSISLASLGELEDRP